MFGKMGVLDSLDKEGPVSKLKIIDKLWRILTSTNAQLEFLTLLGIIINGIMQGYVTSNTIYRFLLENIEQKMYQSCGLNKEDYQQEKES